MKKIFTAAVAAVMMVAATGASAATKTFEATVSNVTGGIELLDELFGTSTGRTLTLLVTFDTDVSSGATYVSERRFDYDILRSGYDAFSLIAPEKTLDAVASDGNSGYVLTEDGIADRGSDIGDTFILLSNVSSLTRHFMKFLLSRLI